VTASDRTDTQARLDAAKLQDRIAALLPSPRPYSASVQAYAGEAVIVDGPALDALAAELERVTAALANARKTVSWFYDDHVIDGDPPCPCGGCTLARKVFADALAGSARAAQEGQVSDTQARLDNDPDPGASDVFSKPTKDEMQRVGGQIGAEILYERWQESLKLEQQAKMGWDESRRREKELRAELERVTAALREITAHPVISEGEFPDDNCDWHCTAELVAKAESALAAQEGER
jgi:hypothetical protein